MAASFTLPFVILLQENGILCHLSFYFAMLLHLAFTCKTRNDNIMISLFLN